MPNDSTGTDSALYSSSNDYETPRLMLDSNGKDYQQSTTVNKENRNSSGYMTRSKKANLVFSVSRVENHLRKGGYAKRINQTASVYLTSTLEYLVVEILELAGEMTHRSNRKRITPRDIALAIKNDQELAKLCAEVTIPEGGVQPFIHEVLLNTSSRRRKRRVRFSQVSIENSSSKQLTNTDGDSSSPTSDIDDSDQEME